MLIPADRIGDCLAHLNVVERRLRHIEVDECDFTHAKDVCLELAFGVDPLDPLRFKEARGNVEIATQQAELAG